MQTVDETFREAVSLLEKGRYEEARPLFDDVLRINPKTYAAANGLGTCLFNLGQVGAAIGAFSHALNLAPNDPVLWTNYGATLRAAGHIQWGRDCYARALSHEADFPPALHAMAGSYVNEGDPLRGLVWARRALAKDKTPNGHKNLALLLLEAGRWDEAWPHWRHREIAGNASRSYPGQRWRGEEVDHLVVSGEQGLGDEIMFLGCLPKLLDRAHASVTVEIAPRLVPLVRASFPSVTVIGSPGEFKAPDGGLSAWSPVGDLAEFCGTPPKVSGYMKAPKVPGYDDAVLMAVWGGTMHTHDYLRNPPLQEWQQVIQAIRDAGLRPVCIQYGQDGAAMAKVLGVEFDDAAAMSIDKQASAIASCRALVSVQQTALHLGGAVGAEVFGVVSNKPAWRYGLRGEMPWYQTVKLYRQDENEKSWLPVMRRIAKEIAKLGREKAA